MTVDEAVDEGEYEDAEANKITAGCRERQAAPDEAHLLGSA